MVEVDDERLVHVVVLVVGIEDDFGIGGVELSDGLPPGLEAGGVSDDGVVEAAVVVRADHSVGAFLRDVVDGLGKVGTVSGIEGASQAGWSKTLHKEVDAEDVHAIANPSVDGGKVIPGIISTINTRDSSSAKFGTRLVDTKELESAR